MQSVLNVLMVSVTHSTVALRVLSFQLCIITVYCFNGTIAIIACDNCYIDVLTKLLAIDFSCD